MEQMFQQLEKILKNSEKCQIVIKKSPNGTIVMENTESYKFENKDE